MDILKIIIILVFPTYYDCSVFKQVFFFSVFIVQMYCSYNMIIFQFYNWLYLSVIYSEFIINKINERKRKLKRKEHAISS